MKHQKHAITSRRKNGIHATNEVALLGVKCSVISNLVHTIANEFTQYNLAYFDASHAKDAEKTQVSEFTFHHDGNLKITTVSPINKFLQRLQFAQYDAVFVNGNHYEASSQIVFLDPEKEASIEKRMNQITDVHFFISTSPEMQPFDSLQEKFPNWKEIPNYSIDDTQSIISHVSTILKETIPAVRGLVLTGGKSSRMGTDKAQLNYHGKPQKEYVKEILQDQGIETFYSVRYSSTNKHKSSTTKEAIKESLQGKKEFDDCCPSEIDNLIAQGMNEGDEIPDAFIDMGPFGGICSAFKKDPNSAWFVLATDVPFVDEKLIQFVLENRNPSKAATTVKGKEKPFPEPLITIYEPKAYPLLLQYLSQGFTCPRKMIINSEVEVLEIDDDLIRNINTPEEFEQVKREIN